MVIGRFTSLSAFLSLLACRIWLHSSLYALLLQAIVVEAAWAYQSHQRR